MNTKALLGRTRRARKNLAFKLMLEKKFLPEIATYFKNISKDFESYYAATGSVLPTPNFGIDTISLLKKQYIRTSRFFINEMRDELRQKTFIPASNFKQDEVTDAQIDATTNAAVALFIDKESKNRSILLNSTNENDMREAIIEAENSLRSQGKEVTNAAVASLAALILRRKFRGRRATIAATETQFIAESTKQIEAHSIATEGQIDITNPTAVVIGAAVIVKKKWAAVLDEKTRPHHITADGQTQPLSEPFIVKGERLMYPGDRSLGASADNTINCRCSSLHTF